MSTVTSVTDKAAAAPTRMFLSAEWRWLAVLNYEIDPALLAPHVPRGVEIDLDASGKTYVSLVAFLFRDTRVLGWSIPGHRNFEELNLRCYVARRDTPEPRRGVVFLKEMVPLVAVSTIARAWYNENYYTVPMRHVVTPANIEEQVPPAARYEFKHGREWNSMRIACHDSPSIPATNSHEAFILEHYWGYCRQRNGGTIEYRVDHPRWTVWPASEVEIDCDFRDVYGPEFARVLSRQPDTAFIADGSPVTVARPTRIC